MRNLLLASNSPAIFDLDYTINGRPKDKVKWAYITTAGNDVPDNSYLKRTEKMLKDLGWDTEEMDIAGKSEDEVYQMLEKKDAIFMQGGNTFYLLKQALSCNFGRVLEKLLNLGKFYAGASAGVYLLCPNIEVATWNNPDKFDRHGLTDLTALKIVPFLVKCHMNRYEDDRAVIMEHAKKSPYEVKYLYDGEALLVEDDKVTLLKK